MSRISRLFHVSYFMSRAVLFIRIQVTNLPRQSCLYKYLMSPVYLVQTSLSTCLYNFFASCLYIFLTSSKKWAKILEKSISEDPCPIFWNIKPARFILRKDPASWSQRTGNSKLSFDLPACSLTALVDKSLINTVLLHQLRMCALLLIQTRRLPSRLKAGDVENEISEQTTARNEHGA